MNVLVRPSQAIAVANRTPLVLGNVEGLHLPVAAAELAQGLQEAAVSAQAEAQQQ